MNSMKRDKMLTVDNSRSTIASSTKTTPTCNTSPISKLTHTQLLTLTILSTKILSPNL